MPRHTYGRSVVKTIPQMKRVQRKEMTQLKAKHRRQLAAIRRTQRAEKYYRKHGEWPKWY